MRVYRACKLFNIRLYATDTMSTSGDSMFSYGCVSEL